MTSKSSFLVNLKENNKRRLWVWVISALIFILAFPVLLLILLSQIKSDTVYFVNTYGEKLAEEIIHERLLNTVRQQLGFSVKMIAATGIAIISAVQGFSWLYSRKKMDFYMGMPVKRQKRYLIIWLNGILIYVVPYLLGLLIEMLIAAGNGALDGTVIYSAFWGFLVNLFFFIGVYHISLLAVMLTGNVIITCFGILVFFLYEFLVRWMVGGYKSFFFRYFDSYNMGTELLTTRTGSMVRTWRDSFCWGLQWVSLFTCVMRSARRKRPGRPWPLVSPSRSLRYCSPFRFLYCQDL